MAVCHYWLSGLPSDLRAGFPTECHQFPARKFSSTSLQFWKNERVCCFPSPGASLAPVAGRVSAFRYRFPIRGLAAKPTGQASVAMDSGPEGSRSLLKAVLQSLITRSTSSPRSVGEDPMVFERQAEDTDHAAEQC